MTQRSLKDWIKTTLLYEADDLTLFTRALTHGSHGKDDYERLEFLGDRVLGLAIADWLYARFPDEPEGMLARRLNGLVSGEVCAEVARHIGLKAYLKLGKQAQDDGVFESENVLGDVVEALIGALWLDGGADVANAFVRHYWSDKIDVQHKPPRHPKAELQEWAAKQNRKPPTYEVVGRSGPDHRPRFTVQVTIKGLESAQGDGSSRQEAETVAARSLLEKLV